MNPAVTSNGVLIHRWKQRSNREAESRRDPRTACALIMSAYGKHTQGRIEASKVFLSSDRSLTNWVPSGLEDV